MAQTLALYSAMINYGYMERLMIWLSTDLPQSIPADILSKERNHGRSVTFDITSCMHVVSLHDSNVVSAAVATVGAVLVAVELRRYIYNGTLSWGCSDSRLNFSHRTRL